MASKARCTNVLVIGVFDLFHRGHVELLRRAHELGDSVFVVVNGDKMTSQYKREPFYSELDRCAIVASLKYVSEAIVSNDFDVKPFVEKFDIDVIVHGDDWDHESYLRQIRVTPDYIRQRNLRFEYLPYYEGTSTSSLIEQIKQS